MYTKVQIINLGLGKISSSLISRIDPPKSPLERYCADGYENWKRTEIAKRRWVFATDDEVALPKAWCTYAVPERQMAGPCGAATALSILCADAG